MQIISFAEYIFLSYLRCQSRQVVAENRSFTQKTHTTAGEKKTKKKSRWFLLTRARGGLVPYGDYGWLGGASVARSFIELWGRRASIGIFVSEAAVGREAILPDILHPSIPFPA